jgi:MFS family permease
MFNRNFFSFLLVCLLTLPRSLIQSLMMISIPNLIEQLDLTDLESQLIVPIFVLGSILFIPLAGFFGDKLGAKKILIYSTYIYVGASFLAGIAATGKELLICIFLMGAAAGSSITQGSTYITELYPIQYRGRVIGIYSSLITLTFFLGPVLGGIVANFGQKGVYWSMLPVMVLALYLSRILPNFYKEKSEDRKREYRVFGSLSFLSHCFIACLWQVILTSITFFPAQYQIYSQLSPLEAGVLFTVLSLPITIFSPIAGWLFDRIGFFIPYLIGYAALSIGWVFSYYDYDREAVVMYCVALGFIMPVSGSASWGFFEQRHRSFATAIYYIFRFLGAFAGGLFGGYLLTAQIESSEVFYLTFSLGLSIVIITLPLVFWVKKIKPLGIQNRTKT